MKLETGIPGRKPKGGIRGQVSGFSRASRRRLIYTIATCGDALPIFVTLTYGKEWPLDRETVKGHLELWWKRVVYENPYLSAIWKIELQERGAPHYHLLVYHKSPSERPFLPHQWVAQSWAEVTGDTSPAHVKAGTRVESIRSKRGAMFYAAKYLGKETAPDADEAFTLGRVWGVLGRNNLPVNKSEYWLTPMEVAAFKYHMVRIVSRSRAAKDVGAVSFRDDEEDYADYLRDSRAKEYEAEMLRDPRRIPHTLIHEYPVALFNAIRDAASRAEAFPDLPESKILDALAKSDTVSIS